jgi:hypothetical protein
MAAAAAMSASTPLFRMLLIVSWASLPRREAATNPRTTLRRSAENRLIDLAATTLTGCNRVL